MRQQRMQQIAKMVALAAAFVTGTTALCAQVPAPDQPVAFSVHQQGDRLPLKPARLLEWDEQEATWASLDLSPDGRTIVFELLGDIYTMPISGGEATCIVCGLPFDSQPVYSPDGREIAFISDRDGNENLWVAQADGSHPRQISQRDENSEFISPEWARDGKSLYVARFKPDMNAFELWRYAASGENHEPLEQVTHAKRSPDAAKDANANALGAALSPDGTALYYEAKTGFGFDDDINFPLWHIVRRDLKTGEERTFLTNAGSAFRPQISPDGQLIVYAVRYEGKTALRMRNIVTSEDRLLKYPVQRDDQEGLSARDLLPRYAFTPDGKSILANYGGRMHRIDVATGNDTEIPFTAHVKLPVGPSLHPQLKQDTGPVRARLLQTLAESPDGSRLIFSAFAHIYLAERNTDGSMTAPRRLTSSTLPEFEPAWSADGEWIVYVTWNADQAGSVWRMRANGTGQPQQLSPWAAYYAYPAFAPDGKSVYVVRMAAYDQLHRAADFAPYPAELVQLPIAEPASAKVLAAGYIHSSAQFTAEQDALYLHFADGLYRVPLDGAKPRRVLRAVGPAYYFMEGKAAADGMRISPDGNWALAQIVQQLYLIRLAPQTETGMEVELDRSSPQLARITSVGADFFGWADHGQTITWSIGSTWFRQSLKSVVLGSSAAPAGTDVDRATVQHASVAVELPRDTPHGAVVLRGATVITMQSREGDGAIADADLLIVDDHIAAVGKRGSVSVPAGATVLDVSGRFIVPGFIDAHIHWGSIRRGILDSQCWEFAAGLAYGVTSALDPSSLSIDMFAYQDMLDAGLMPGTRVFTTGPALFSFNQIRTQEQAINNIRRNPEFYRTRNLKEYRTGNRAQRQMVAAASRSLDLLTTAEGALDMKLDMTQLQDGLSSNEHAYSAVPLGHDIVQLFARTGASYTPTLQISNGGMFGQDYFFSRTSPFNDAKVRRFLPHFVLERKMERLHYGEDHQYSFPAVAEGAARIQRAGGVVAVGSHGEVPGIGYHFELQALAMGGMTPAEVLWAATMGSAQAIGRASEFGSLQPGKYADLIVLDRNPLIDIHNTLSIRSVMKNGRLYDGDTLNESWPNQRQQPIEWWQREEQQSANSTRKQ